jgi:hypothetical protein
MFDVLIYTGRYWMVACRRNNMNSCREFINRYYPEGDVENTVVDRGTGNIFDFPITKKPKKFKNPVNWKIDGF